MQTMMIVFVSIFLSLVEGVANNPIQPQESPRVSFSLSTLLNISKLIDEANRCPSQTQNTLCPWTWEPEIKENRIPRVIYKAKKRTDSLCESNPNTECRSEKKQFDVVYLTQNSQGVYDLLPNVEELPVAMTCVQKQREYVVNGEDVDYNDFD
ncbi:uncharacterized protein LOC125660838 [Ostrea edulis]|uniref:uncharacterized protein LOC125660838 n=1 Tax=Ostrea edulis TaxID=37623 RepID=UPI002094CD20|nr:uncharacterized protein LOC125660838 [Ostrea edulis]XP_056002862.1 uncharacterized protein LOC125660838 [Ostrea edulis]